MSLRFAKRRAFIPAVLALLFCAPSTAAQDTSFDWLIGQWRGTAHIVGFNPPIATYTINFVKNGNEIRAIMAESSNPNLLRGITDISGVTRWQAWAPPAPLPACARHPGEWIDATVDFGTDHRAIAVNRPTRIGITCDLSNAFEEFDLKR
jgi:hypothetical protein